MAPEKMLLPYQDYFLRMPDDRTRKEILGGDLYATPAPTPAHQRVVAELVSVEVYRLEGGASRLEKTLR